MVRHLHPPVAEVYRQWRHHLIRSCQQKRPAPTVGTGTGTRGPAREQPLRHRPLERQAMGLHPPTTQRPRRCRTLHRHQHPDRPDGIHQAPILAQPTRHPEHRHPIARRRPQLLRPGRRQHLPTTKPLNRHRHPDRSLLRNRAPRHGRRTAKRRPECRIWRSPPVANALPGNQQVR